MCWWSGGIIKRAREKTHPLPSARESLGEKFIVFFMVPSSSLPTAHPITTPSPYPLFYRNRKSYLTLFFNSKSCTRKMLNKKVKNLTDSFPFWAKLLPHDTSTQISINYESVVTSQCFFKDHVLKCVLIGQMYDLLIRTSQ